MAHAAILSYVRQPGDERSSLYPPLRALAQEAGLSNTQVYKEIEAGHGGQQEELLASQCTASQRPKRMRLHACIDHRKPYVYPRVLHRAVSTFSTRSCAHRHLRAPTPPQLPYSVCEARILPKLRREVAREGTEDWVAIALVVLVQCRFVRLHQ